MAGNELDFDGILCRDCGSDWRGGAIFVVMLLDRTATCAYLDARHLSGSESIPIRHDSLFAFFGCRLACPLALCGGVSQPRKGETRPQRSCTSQLAGPAC